MHMMSKQRWIQDTQACLLLFSIQIFVVDSSSNDDDVDLAAAELQEALSHPSLGTLPLLVLANKQDVQGARSTEEVSFCCRML